jgi:hypothetical protein
VLDRREQMLPHLPLAYPPAGGLARERAAVEAQERREPVPVVPPEVAIQPGVGINAQELADDFHRQYLAIAQRGGKTPLPQARLLGQPRVNHAGHRDDERVKSHREASLRLCRLSTAQRSEVSLLWQSPKGAHRVM